MRGDERVQDEMFSSVTLEQRVPQDHPLREIRKLSDTVLRSLSAEFGALYSASGRPSIAPEYMLQALLLQAFYSVRSERLLVEEIDYNLLFRWFVGLGMDDAVWNHAVFSKNRDRLLNSTVAQGFFAAGNEHAKKFMSDDHFTVDGTLIQGWASQKSFRRAGWNRETRSRGCGARGRPGAGGRDQSWQWPEGGTRASWPRGHPDQGVRPTASCELHDAAIVGRDAGRGRPGPEGTPTRGSAPPLDELPHN